MQGQARHPKQHCQSFNTSFLAQLHHLQLETEKLRVAMAGKYAVLLSHGPKA